MQMRLFLFVLFFLPFQLLAETLYARLQADPASVDVCGFYSEEKFRDLLGIEGEFFSQSVDAAYRRVAEEGGQQPDFAGCWWRLKQGDNDFVMMQLMLHPAGAEEARRRIDKELSAAAEINSPLLPQRIDGLAEAGFWSPLGRRVRWRQGEAIVAELLISQKSSSSQLRQFKAAQLQQLSIQAAQEIATVAAISE